MASQFKNVLLAGATGALGSAFAATLLASGLNVTLLVRDGYEKDAKKKEALDKFVSQGAKLVTASLTSQESLQAALKGIDLVISTLNGEGLFVTNGDIELARASKAVGVKRFVPSNWGLDSRGLTSADLPLITNKFNAIAELEKIGLDYVVVYTNTWLEYALGFPFLGFDVVHADSVLVPGDGNGRVSLTSIGDVPKLALPAILDPSLHNAAITVSSNSHTWNEIISAAERFRGKSIEKKFFDAAQIRAIISEQKEPFAIFGLTLHSFGVTEPQRLDLHSKAYNVVHAEKYANLKTLSLNAYLEAAVQKK